MQPSSSDFHHGVKAMPRKEFAAVVLFLSNLYLLFDGNLPPAILDLVKPLKSILPEGEADKKAA